MTKEKKKKPTSRFVGRVEAMLERKKIALGWDKRIADMGLTRNAWCQLGGIDPGQMCHLCKGKYLPEQKTIDRIEAVFLRVEKLLLQTRRGKSGKSARLKTGRKSL